MVCLNHHHSLDLVDVDTLFVGKTLYRKLLTAIGECREQRDAFDDFSSRLLVEDVARWSGMIDEWEKDPSSAPNPFEPAVPGKVNFWAVDLQH